MALICNPKKILFAARGDIPPSNVEEGVVWFDTRSNNHMIYTNNKWERLFDDNRILGPQTYEVKLYGIETEVMERIRPLIKLYGIETEVMEKIRPQIKLYGIEAEVMIQT